MFGHNETIEAVYARACRARWRISRGESWFRMYEFWRQQAYETAMCRDAGYTRTPVTSL